MEMETYRLGRALRRRPASDVGQPRDLFCAALSQHPCGKATGLWHGLVLVYNESSLDLTSLFVPGVCAPDKSISLFPLFYVFTFFLCGVTSLASSAHHWKRRCRRRRFVERLAMSDRGRLAAADRRRHRGDASSHFP